MNRERLLKKVQEYFEKTFREMGLERHDADEVNNWDIYSGILDRDFHREKLATYHGKFSNAVAWLVQHPKFHGLRYFPGLKCPEAFVREGLVKKCEILELLDYQIPTHFGREVPKPDYRE